MKKLSLRGLYVTVCPVLLLFIVSCSSISYLKVNYHLPAQTNELTGKKVFLAFRDERQNKNLLGEGARQDFKNFSENISLTISRGNEEGSRIGVFDLPALFLEAFKRKFEASGITVVKEKEEAPVEVDIVLTEFLLDQANLKWQFDMAYEARAVKGGEALAKQMISGQSERVKLLGLREADILVGESFTALVNKLDVGRLLQQAGL